MCFHTERLFADGNLSDDVITAGPKPDLKKNQKKHVSVFTVLIYSFISRSYIQFTEYRDTN